VTASAGTPGLSAQARTLDGLMRLSEQGRAAAVSGATDVAIASRVTLLDDLRALRARATDTQLKAGLTRLIAAIRESLRQNRTCGTRCTTADLRARRAAQAGGGGNAQPDPAQVHGPRISGRADMTERHSATGTPEIRAPGRAVRRAA